MIKFRQILFHIVCFKSFPVIFSFMPEIENDNFFQSSDRFISQSKLSVLKPQHLLERQLNSLPIKLWGTENNS